MEDKEDKFLPVRPKYNWLVVAIYQDDYAKTRAVVVCDQLVRRFLGRVEFQFQWFKFNKLITPKSEAAAVSAIAMADIIVCAIDIGAQIPARIVACFDEFVARRRNREGTFIGLVGRENDPLEKKSVGLNWLRGIARRAGMDFLSEAAPTGLWMIPESLPWLHQRADQLSLVLSEILCRPATSFITRPEI